MVNDLAGVSHIIESILQLMCLLLIKIPSLHNSFASSINSFKKSSELEGFCLP